MSVIDEIKQKVDIVEVVGGYTKLTKSGKTFKGLCPFHSEKHGSFFVYPEQQSWHCFGACNTGGDVFSFLMKKEGITFGEALGMLAERTGVVLTPRVESEAEKQENERLYQANQVATQYFNNILINSSAGERARNYMAKRGIVPKTITDFQLGFSLSEWEALKTYLLGKGFTDSELLQAGLVVQTDTGGTYDRFRQRIIFPIFDQKGRTIGFGGRAMDDALPKYLNSPQTPLFDKGKNFYAIHIATPAIRKQDSVIIVEGYMDALQAHQNRYSNVLASMGTAITEEHISRLKKLTKNVILAMDSDTAGEEAMLRCASYENALDSEIKVIILPEGKDPDDVIREDPHAWEKLVQEAQPVVDYTFSMVTAKLDLTTLKGKNTATERLGPLITNMANKLRQVHYKQKLAGLLKIDERNLEAVLAGLKKSQPVRRIQPSSAETSPPQAGPLADFLPVSLEEYCLALLLQYPEFKLLLQNPEFTEKYGSLLPEHFEHSENREIFIALQKANELSLIQEVFSSPIKEHLNSLLERSKEKPSLANSGKREEVLGDCVSRLHEQFLKNSERAITQALRLAAESGASIDEIASLQERSCEISSQLRQIYTRKIR